MISTKITQLNFYPGNARRGDIDMIADSLKANGQVAPIIVNKGTKAPDLANTIISGNHTTMAAQRIGWKTIGVEWVDLDAEACRRVVLVMNKANDAATYDLPELTELLGDGPLAGTGFTQDELDAMLEAMDHQSDDLDDGGVVEDFTTEDFDLTVQCESAGQRDMLRARLVSEGFTVD